MAAWVLNKNDNNIKAYGKGEWLAKIQLSVSVYVPTQAEKVGLAPERGDRALDCILGTRGKIVFILGIKCSIFLKGRYRG